MPLESYGNNAEDVAIIFTYAAMDVHSSDAVRAIVPTNKEKAEAVLDFVPTVVYYRITLPGYQDMKVGNSNELTFS